ncbi:MAG: Crp/Fnr family transcriptional regulator [Armatimonadota bacterium]
MRRQFPDQQTGWIRDVFEGLDEATLNSLKNSGTPRSLAEGERLTDVNNAVVRVESGLVRLSVTADDRSLTIALFGPGDTICAPLFHEWDNELYYLEAQEASEVTVIPQDSVLQACSGNVDLSRRVMRQLSWATWQLMHSIHMLAFYNLPQRVAQVLVNLAASFGVRNRKGGISVGLRFTQQELAEMAGARRETLSTVLQEFREDDVLDLRYARIEIKDFEALKRIAGTEPLPFLSPREL